MQPLDDWSELIHAYSDTHDGYYRDWSVYYANHIADLLKGGKEFRTAAKKSANPAVATLTVTSSSSDSQSQGSVDHINGSGSRGGGNGSGRFSIVPPPVPSSMVHPACWGMHARDVAQEVSRDFAAASSSSSSLSSSSAASSSIYERIHPGACTTTILDPPGAQAIHHQHDDIDDFSFHNETLLRELRALEASNYVRLQALSKYVEPTTNRMEHIRAKRLRIGEVISALCTEAGMSDSSHLMLPSSSRAISSGTSSSSSSSSSSTTALAAFESISSMSSSSSSGSRMGIKDHIPAITTTTSATATATNHNTNITTTSRYGTRGASNSAPIVKTGPPTVLNQFGPILQRQCSRSSLNYLLQLDVGDAVEYYCDVEHRWFPGTVVARRYEGHSPLLRSFQIYALGSFAGDYTRVGVEEGHRLASPGSNLNPTVFRYYGIDVNAVKDKHSISLSSAAASSSSAAAAAPSSSSSLPFPPLIQPQQPCSTEDQGPFVKQSRQQQPHLQQPQQQQPQLQQQSQRHQPQRQQPDQHSPTEGCLVSVEGAAQLKLAGAGAAPRPFQVSHFAVVQVAKDDGDGVASGEAAAAITTTTAATTTAFSLASSDSGMSGRSNSSEGSSSSYDDRSLSPATLTDSPLALIDETSSAPPPPPSKQQQLQQQSTHAGATTTKQTPINGCCINGIGINGANGAKDVEEKHTDKGSDKDNVSDSDGTKTTREDRRNHGSSGNGNYGNGSYGTGHSSSNGGGGSMPMEATNIDDSRSDQ